MIGCTIVTCTTIAINLILLYSVQLARRVLKLERINSSLRRQVDALDKEKKALDEQVRVGKSMQKHILLCTPDKRRFQWLGGNY